MRKKNTRAKNNTEAEALHREQIDQLNHTCVRVVDNDPDEGMRLAKQALRLSTSLGDKGRLAESLASIAACHERLSDHTKALRSLDKAMSLCLEVGDADVEARILHQRGIIHTNTGAYPAAVECLERSLEIARELDDEYRQATVNNSLGVVYNLISHNARALGHFQECLRLCERHDNGVGIIWAINNIGTIYLTIGDVPRAFEHFRKAIGLLVDGDHGWMRLVLETNLATSLYRLGRKKDGHRHAMRALDLCRSAGMRPKEAYTLHLIGQFTDDKHERLATLRRALDIAIDIQDPIRVAIEASLGSLLLSTGHISEGLLSLETASAEAERIEDVATRRFIHEELSAYYESLGDTATALYHHKRQSELNNIIRGQDEQRRIIEMEMRGEIERAERDREIFRLEKLRLEREMEHKTAELTAMALNLIEKNQFLQSLKNEMAGVTEATGAKGKTAVKDLLRKVNGNLHTERDWNAFEAQFESVHHDFLSKVAIVCPSLTRTELKVCALLKLNMSSKEVADILSTSVRTAENHRYRIRKKLGLPDDINVSTYFAGLGKK